MTPGDLIQIMRPTQRVCRKGTIIKIIGFDDRYSNVKIMWHPWGDTGTTIETHTASWVASHCSILCNTASHKV